MKVCETQANFSMGCTVSYSFTRKFSTNFTSRQVETIACSWNEVMKQREVFGIGIYKLLLESERELRKLFPKIVCYDNVERFTVDEEHLRRHALLVMDGIGFAVECLDDVGKLDHFLKMVGKRHYESRVPERVLKKLWPALDGSFTATLRDTYSREARKAWHFFFHYMVNVMKIGMNEAEMRDVSRRDRKLSD
ncbi:neuroglobin-like [Haliotis cracherodii]|uniref:neuroglobin-like n=1 Tax=Haliotis cracherodii TaxID=6455 RepID=UPI0039ECEC0E